MTEEEKAAVKITEGSALDVLRREAVALMRPDPDGGDANWVQVTEGIRNGIYLQTMTPAEIARLATEDLAEAAEEWRAESRCDHPRMEGGECAECGERCSRKDVGATGTLCHDPGCPIHGSV